MNAVTLCRDFGAQENKIYHSFHFFTFYLPWSDGIGCHDLCFFLKLNFKPAFSLSSFTLIKRLFSSFLLSTIRLVSSAYLRLLIFLLAILIPTCDSSSPLQNSLYEGSKVLIYVQTEVSSVTGTHTSYFEQCCQYSSLSLECLIIINI